MSTDLQTNSSNSQTPTASTTQETKEFFLQHKRTIFKTLFVLVLSSGGFGLFNLSRNSGNQSNELSNTQRAISQQNTPISVNQNFSTNYQNQNEITNTPSKLRDLDKEIAIAEEKIHGIEGVVELVSKELVEKEKSKKTSMNIPYNLELRTCEFNKDIDWQPTKPKKCSFLEITHKDKMNMGGNNFATWCFVYGEVRDKTISGTDLKRLLIVSPVVMNDLLPVNREIEDVKGRASTIIKVMTHEELFSGQGAKERQQTYQIFQSYCPEL